VKFLFASYVRSSGFTNPEDWLRRLAAYFGVLEALALEHEVISIEQIGCTAKVEKNGVQYYFMDFGNRARLLFPYRLHRFIKKQKPDIIIIHGIVFPLQVMQLRLQAGRKTKIIVQSHSNHLPGKYTAILQRLADRWIDAYFFTAMESAHEWVGKKLIGDPKKIKEVMVGSSVFVAVDKTKARELLGIPQNTPVFLWVGRLDSNKDPMTVLKTFLRFVAQYAGARLYFIYQAEDMLGRIKSYLSENDPAATVKLVGKVEHQRMADWLSSTDYFISSSWQEVFGAAVVEAMSCGCIPIVTDIPSFRQITAEGDCGFLYERGNENELLQRLEETIHADTAAIRARIRQQYQDNLSFQAIAKRIQEICKTL
jgi:glycosyltransferase involved in cell wall biosynthesis